MYSSCYWGLSWLDIDSYYRTEPANRLYCIPIYPSLVWLLCIAPRYGYSWHRDMATRYGYYAWYCDMATPRTLIWLLLIWLLLAFQKCTISRTPTKSTKYFNVCIPWPPRPPLNLPSTSLDLPLDLPLNMPPEPLPIPCNKHGLILGYQAN